MLSSSGVLSIKAQVVWNCFDKKISRRTIMGYLGLLCFIQFVVMQFPISVAQQQNFLRRYCISERGNFTTNSTYQANLDSLVSSFSNTTIDGGFYNSSAGDVKAMGLCRADLSPDDCRICMDSSSHDTRRLCPNYKEAIVYYDTCMFRYSDRSIFGIPEIAPYSLLYNTQKLSDVNRTNEVVRKLLSGLRDEAAAASGPLRKYSVGETEVDSETTFYALVQCTPDLEDAQCAECLFDLNATVISNHANLTQGTRGANIMGPSCNFRYETYSFYESLHDAPSPSPSASPSPSPSDLSPPVDLSPAADFPSPPSNGATSGNGKNNRKRTAILIAVPTVVSIVLFISISTCILLRMQKPTKKVQTESEHLQFDLNIIKIATNNFSDANKLGEGGFGPVYKGLLPNGTHVAVKRLSKDSEQGELEFKNEVLLVAKLQHRNLVRLSGFCLQGNERVLIYEFMPNASLDHFIFDPDKRSQLNWERRYKIIEGIARGLLYLHEDSRFQIVHRDLKASNILLDMEMNPKISDFGIARLFSVDQTQGQTSIIVGTHGYMAPEYAMHGNFSMKSDVYSFGVLTLEILSGKRNNGFDNEADQNVENLVNYAWRSWREGTLANLVDAVLGSGYMSDIMRCIHIALLCVEANAAERPTMGSVVVMLSSASLTLPIPSALPAQNQMELPLVAASFMHASPEPDLPLSSSSSV